MGRSNTPTATGRKPPIPVAFQRGQLSPPGPYSLLFCTDHAGYLCPGSGLFWRPAEMHFHHPLHIFNAFTASGRPTP
ncbi:hypothetical protein FVEN_g12850 [Fusarium venenatum]|nr:hypothetical protein FVEN_g12850 [Fusarium venenatum]